MGGKRGFLDPEELTSLRVQLLQQLSVHLEEEPTQLHDRIFASASCPTLIEIGLKSAACSALKGWATLGLSHSRPPRTLHTFDTAPSPSSPPSSPPCLTLFSHLSCPQPLGRWIFHVLEAELTTFELFKTPIDQLLESIAQARTRSVGLHTLPTLQTRRQEGEAGASR